MSDFTTINNGWFGDHYSTGSVNIVDTIFLPIDGFNQRFDNTLSQMREVDRTVWAGPGRVIFSEARDYRNEDNGQHPARSWKNNSWAETNNTKDYISIRTHGVIFTIPNVFPGSNNFGSIHDGSTITNGFLAVETLGKGAVISTKIRKIAIGANGTATVGSWSNCYLNHTNINRYNWQTGSLLFPSGTQPGDTCELQIAFKQFNTGSAGYLGGIMVYEPRLTTVA